MRPIDQLFELVRQHPEARIVSDVGASMFSGFGELREAVWHSDINTIELVFD